MKRPLFTHEIGLDQLRKIGSGDRHGKQCRIGIESESTRLASESTCFVHGREVIHSQLSGSHLVVVFFSFVVTTLLDSRKR